MFPSDFQRKSVWSIAFSNIHTACSNFYRLLPDLRRFSCVKVCSLRPSRAFTARVNALKTNPSHQKRWKSGENTLCVKEVNAFSGNLIRIYAHVKGRFKTDGGIFSVTEPPRLSSPTSRDVLFTTRRLVRTSPGVGKTNPGLVRTTPGLNEIVAFFCPFKIKAYLCPRNQILKVQQKGFRTRSPRNSFGFFIASSYTQITNKHPIF